MSIELLPQEVDFVALRFDEIHELAACDHVLHARVLLVGAIRSLRMDYKQEKYVFEHIRYSQLFFFARTYGSKKSDNEGKMETTLR